MLDRNIGDYYCIIVIEDFIQVFLVGFVYIIFNKYQFVELNVVIGDYKSVIVDKFVMVIMFGKIVSMQIGDVFNGGDLQFSIFLVVLQFLFDYMFSMI